MRRMGGARPIVATGITRNLRSADCWHFFSNSFLDVPFSKCFLLYASPWWVYGYAFVHFSYHDVCLGLAYALKQWLGVPSSAGLVIEESVVTRHPSELVLDKRLRTTATKVLEERLMKQCADLEHQLALARADIVAWQLKTTVAQLRAAAAEKTNAELQELLEGSEAAAKEGTGDSDNIDDENPVPINPCHMCRKEIALVAMVPCGHLCICTECRKKCRRLCLVCNEIVDGTMRIYFC
ncbi:hypothetical protein Cni_G21923 [Canna indica]|uniref:RING-type domain-containing protein n=1 Tax=Canna indica TaxID=4628 RepID=A0AAQ3QJ60_9LILI|nr:hypothetical protein Cni_G21923 [Canna indica]